MNDSELRKIVKRYLDEENWFEAWRYSTRIWEKTADDFFFLAVACNGLGNVPATIFYLRKASKLNPDKYLEIYYDALSEVKRSERLVILCVPENYNFIKDVYYTLRNIFTTRLIVTRDANKIKQAYNWADIVWIECANDLAEFVTNTLERKKTVFRMFGDNLYDTEKINKINWGKISYIFFVGEHIKNKTLELCPNLNNINYSVIVNGVNLNEYRYSTRKPGKKIALAGAFNSLKNPEMLAQIIKELVKIDPEYMFYWAGKVQDDKLFDNFLQVLKNFEVDKHFKFELWSEDINDWLEDKSVFLSTSWSFGYGHTIMEAMSKGIKPVIYKKAYYPEELSFETPESAVKMIVSEEYTSEKYRKFIEENYSVDSQILEIYKVLSTL